MRKSLLAILIIISIAGQSRAQLINLRLNLVPGQTYYYLTMAKVAVTQTAGKLQTNVNSNITSRIAFKVTGIRDSLYDLQMTYQALSLEMHLPGNNVVSYNADKNDPNDVASGIFGAFKNQVLTAVMTKSGNLQSVKGFDAIYNKITAGFTTAAPELVAQMKSLLDQSFGEAAFKSNFEMAMPVYPAVPVKKGVLWTSDSQLISNTPAYVHTVYDLRDIQDAYYHIHASSIITYPDKDKFIDNAGRLMRYNLSGNILADMVVDKTTGWVKQSTITQQISGTTETKTPAKLAGTFTMPFIVPIIMRSEITVTDVH